MVAVMLGTTDKWFPELPVWHKNVFASAPILADFFLSIPSNKFG